MRHQPLLFTLVAATNLTACAAPATPPAPGGVPLALRFRAQAGDQALTTSGPEPQAGQAVYQGLGQDAKPIRPIDFRFYVHDVRLLDAEGREAPVTLDANAWQHRNLALLDLDKGTTPEFNDTVQGRVAPGSYRGVRFTLGVPADLNHLDKALGGGPNDAPHPILAWDNHATTMGWSWMAGRKYAKIDFAVPQADGTEKVYYFHFGGLGASNPTKQDGPSHEGFQPGQTRLAEPNLAVITLMDVDPLAESGAIVADLKSFLANVPIGNGGSWFAERQKAAANGPTSGAGHGDHGAGHPAQHALLETPGGDDTLRVNLGLHGGPQRLFRWAR